MLTAITRQVSPAMAKCELSFIARQQIDLEKAQRQHRAYEGLLEKHGYRVISLAAEPHLPDSMFVEDPAIVLDELAVIFRLGAESRQGEAESLSAAVRKFRKLEFLKPPGTVEGGDVLRVGRKLFVGMTRRSNEEGIRQLRGIVGPFGYEVISVAVKGCLHLKSAVTLLRDTVLLANRAWFDTSVFRGFECVEVEASEAHAANALALGETIVLPASFPGTREKLLARGFRVTPIDISELQKAESGLTCSSLLFDA